MNDKQEYITISDYAKLKGVSTTAIYKRLSTSLKPFLIMVEGKKCLKIEVLEEDCPNGSQPLETYSYKRVSNVGNHGKSQEKDDFSQILVILQAQLEEKDRQIERLQEEIKELHTLAAEKEKSIFEKDRHIQEQAVKLSELLEQSQELNKNNQILIARSQETQQLLDDGDSKSSFWQRVFKKKKNCDCE